MTRLKNPTSKLILVNISKIINVHLFSLKTPIVITIIKISNGNRKTKKIIPKIPIIIPISPALKPSYANFSKNRNVIRVKNVRKIQSQASMVPCQGGWSSVSGKTFIDFKINRFFNLHDLLHSEMRYISALFYYFLFTYAIN